jgi:hypothetical protein
MNDSGMSFCRNCSAGYYSIQRGAVECIGCTVGSYSLSGYEACQPCQKGSFVNISFAKTCTSCVEYASTSDVGSKLISQCVCLQGYFGRAYNNMKCLKCPERKGITCSLNSSLPALDQGFFRSPFDPNNALECFPQEACLSTDSDSFSTNCAKGYTGWICGSCIPFEYYKLGAKCVDCPSLTWKVLIYLAFSVLLLVGLWKFATLKSFASIVDFRIILFWIQIMALFPQLSNSWPEVIAKFFRFISFLNLDFEISSPGN